jgi:hypothetical protein
VAWVARGLTPLIVVVLAACDPLGPDDPYLVTIVNDTPRAVLVLRCDDNACDDAKEPRLLAPGERMKVGVSTVGVPNVQLVVEPGTERELGCLPLVMPEPTEGVIARVSQRVPCTSDLDEDKPWPPQRFANPS